MARWLTTLDLSDFWSELQAAKDPDVCQAAETIAAKLEQLPQVGDADFHQERQRLVENFRAFSEAGKQDADAFDDIFSELYDWADTSVGGLFVKACWVKTIA